MQLDLDMEREDPEMGELEVEREGQMRERVRETMRGVPVLTEDDVYRQLHGEWMTCLPLYGGSGEQDDPLWEFDVSHLRWEDDRFYADVGNVTVKGGAGLWWGPQVVTPRLWTELFVPLYETAEEEQAARPEYRQVLLRNAVLRELQERVEWMRERLKRDWQGVRRLVRGHQAEKGKRVVQMPRLEKSGRRVWEQGESSQGQSQGELTQEQVRGCQVMLLATHTAAVGTCLLLPVAVLPTACSSSAHENSSL